MNTLTSAILLGTGATALTDLWGLIRRPLLGIAAPDYGLVGRWLGYMPQGRFRHAAIAKASPVRGEVIIGWVAHYVTGMAYGGLLIALAGRDWLQHPSAFSALVVGIGTVAAPFLLMQPGMGGGIAASHSPHPARARLHSVIMHAVFGIGLYTTGLCLLLFPAG